MSSAALLICSTPPRLGSLSSLSPDSPYSQHPLLAPPSPLPPHETMASANYSALLCLAAACLLAGMPLANGGLGVGCWGVCSKCSRLHATLPGGVSPAALHLPHSCLQVVGCIRRRVWPPQPSAAQVGGTIDCPAVIRLVKHACAAGDSCASTPSRCHCFPPGYLQAPPLPPPLPPLPPSWRSATPPRSTTSQPRRPSPALVCCPRHVALAAAAAVAPQLLSLLLSCASDCICRGLLAAQLLEEPHLGGTHYHPHRPPAAHHLHCTSAHDPHHIASHAQHQQRLLPG